jgi:hypothetical protein
MYPARGYKHSTRGYKHPKRGYKGISILYGKIGTGFLVSLENAGLNQY